MKRFASLLALVAVVAISAQARAEVLVDSFEDGTVAPWVADTPDATLSIDNTAASDGTSSLLVQRATADGASRNDLKLDPAGDVIGNTTLLFDVMATGGEGNDVPGWWLNLTPIINNAGGWAQGADLAITLDGQWHTYSYEYAANGSYDENTAWAQIFVQGNSGGSTTGFQYHIDNVRVTPEPASLALMGLGGLMMLRRR